MKCMSFLGFDRRCDKTTNLIPTYFFNPLQIDHVDIAINCQYHSDLILKPYIKEYEDIQKEIDAVQFNNSSKDISSDYGKILLVPEIKQRRFKELNHLRSIITNFQCRNPQCQINGNQSYEIKDNKLSNYKSLDKIVYTAYLAGQHGRFRTILNLHRSCWEQLKRKTGLDIHFNMEQSITNFI